MPNQAAPIDDILAELESLGDDKVRARNKKLGAGEKQCGVPLGELRKVAKKLKANRELALSLWKTGNLDARLLAVLLLKPKDLTAAELDRMVREASFAQLADWLNAYIVKNHAEKETLRQKWMQDTDPWAARAGWNLTAARIANDHAGLNLTALLDRIEKEMPTAPAATQWTMNNTLGAIGIHHAQHRKRAIAIGEKIGLYKDWPVSKGCIPPYVPVWVEEMVRRQG
jgi:3-methyladenine DNA glycosylase AlkD